VKIMKRQTNTEALVLSLVFLLFSTHAFADEVNLVGKVNDAYQIVADGQIYEVNNNAAGDDLVLNYIRRKVKVTGTVKETNGVKIITVKSFEVLNE